MYYTRVKEFSLFTQRSVQRIHRRPLLITLYCINFSIYLRNLFADKQQAHMMIYNVHEEN